jgi:hypothetical protein
MVTVSSQPPLLRVISQQRSRSTSKSVQKESKTYIYQTSIHVGANPVLVNSFNPLIRAESSWPHHHLKVPPPNTVTVAVKFQHEFQREHSSCSKWPYHTTSVGQTYTKSDLHSGLCSQWDHLHCTHRHQTQEHYVILCTQPDSWCTPIVPVTWEAWDQPGLHSKATSLKI